MKTFRVVIESIDDDGGIEHRVELRAPHGSDPSLALGLACAGAISGICVYDEPFLDAVIYSMLWRMDVESDLLKAAGLLKSLALGEIREERSVDEIAMVVFRRDFLADPLWGVAVDELPTRSTDGAASVG